MRPLRILFVTPYVPSRLRPRPFHLIRGLAARGHRIALFAIATSETERVDADALRPYCERVEVRRLSIAQSLWSCARGLRGRQPLQALYCASPAMTAQITSALAPPAAYDVLHVEHLRAALYGLGAPLRPRVYDAVDCMSSLLARAAEHGPTWMSRATARVELARTRSFERAALVGFDRVLLTSEDERQALLALASGAAAERVHALPNGVDLDYFAPGTAARDAETLIFVGRMGYHANLAGAYRLLHDIMPLVWAQRPAARLLLVGADPPAALRTMAARAGERVQVTGWVPDVRPYLARATVSLSPLPYAVGIQNKVLEAMAMATPVVASPMASAALGAVPGVDLLVEADAGPFAAAVLRLLADAPLAARIGAAGQRYVNAHHDWRQATVRLETIYGDAIAASAGLAATPGAREAVS